jgi:uncharacterized Zn-binding protein involved in type VI secretion
MMTLAARLNDAISTGHPCDPASTIQGNLQQKVRINNIWAAVEGDPIAPHQFLSGGACIDHPGMIVNSGSSKVFIMGISAARKDDSADMGVITGHSSNVDFGG